MGSKIGHYAFLLGVILAIITGFFPGVVAYSVTILVILGLIVGFLNVTAKETHGFLVAAIALMVAGGAGLGAITWAGIGDYLTRILGHIVIFVAPAAIVVALKSVIALAED